MATEVSAPVRRWALHAAACLAAPVLAGLAACGGGGGGAGTDPAPAAAVQVQAAAPQASSADAATSTNTPPATASAAITSFNIRASAAVYAGLGAMVTVRYNGVALATAEVRGPDVASYRFDTATPIDGGVLDIVFGNASDAQGNPVRHLQIESIGVGNLVMQATDTQARFDRGDGVAAFDGQDVLPGRSTLTRNGALRVNVPSAVQLAGATATGAAAATATAAAGFYVDANSGDDANAGGIDHPWRTLGRLASVKLLPGQGIYLRCGSLWRESLALSATQLADGSTVAGYGSECSSRKAVISGADDLSGGWVQNGNVWSRSVPGGTPKINQLFINGEALHTAQWPDAAGTARPSLLAAAGALSNAQLVLQAADASALAGRDLAGATVQLRTQPWFIETRRVTSNSSGTVALDQALDWTLEPGEGFVLQDKLWMLDSPGEFFHDTAAQKLYLIKPAVGAPADLNTARIEGSVRDVALAISQRSGVVLRDLALRAARLEGLHLTDAPQARISQIEATDNGFFGVRLEQFQTLPADTPGPSVSDSLLAGNGQYGLKGQDVQRAVISHNRVLATGTGAHQLADVQSAIAAGPGAQITDNTIDGSGYLGIDFSARGGSLVARNTVSGHCTRLSDCGAIYTWQGRAQASAVQSATVEANRVLGGQADLAGAVSEGREVVVGVYLDDFSRNVAVRGNVLAGTPIGIFLHNASNTTVENNRIWLPTLAGISASMDQSDADWLTGNVFRNNEIMPLVQAQASAGAKPSFATSQAVWFGHSLSGEAALAAGRNTFSGNTVLQMQGPLWGHAWLRGPSGQRYADAIDWQLLNPGEPLPARPARFDTLSLGLGPELATGGGFDSGLGPWGYYQNPAGTGFAVRALASLAGCTGPCVSLTAGSSGDLLGSPPFSLRPGAQYVYRWTAVMPANSAATVAFPYISRNVSPWDVMADGGGFTGYGPRHGAAGEALAYEVFFTAKDSDPARVNLELETMGVAVAFDAVSVREVTASAAAQASDWAALAFAPADAARSVGCAELGWPAGCKAIGLDGQPVALPLALAAGTQQMLLRGDSALRR